jgi:hypothetical protein
MKERPMNPIISAALADERMSDLRHAAEVVRRAQVTQSSRARGRTAGAPRLAVPFMAIRGWLARGYL